MGKIPTEYDERKEAKVPQRGQEEEEEEAEDTTDSDIRGVKTNQSLDSGVGYLYCSQCLGTHNYSELQEFTSHHHHHRCHRYHYHHHQHQDSGV